MNIQDVQHLAMLARLDIPAEEQESLLADLTAMVSYIDQISALDIVGREQTVGDVRNIMREDTVENVPGANTAVIMAEVPSTEDGFVKVKKIL